MGDLLGFEGYLNETAPFAPEEHKVVWKSSRRYLDFDIGTEYNKTCNLPRFWNETGERVEQVWLDEFGGCYDSEFDQVLDIALCVPMDGPADKFALVWRYRGFWCFPRLPPSNYKIRFRPGPPSRMGA